MKKAPVIILSFIGILLLTTSCDKKKSYADLLRDEIKIIDKFIAKNGIVLLDKFPEDTIFKSNEFYRDPATGVYFNIISKGENRKAEEGEEIYLRYDGLRIISAKNDTITFSTLNAPNPSTLIFRGQVTMANKSIYASTTPAWVVPLRYIGHKGRAKMIVPFTMGSRSETLNYQTTYYDLVSYVFEYQRK